MAGMTHGEGLDGGMPFDLLIWQLLWPINYLIYRARKRLTGYVSPLETFGGEKGADI